WIYGEGWPGDFKLQSEAEWLKWEKQYSEIILSLAKLSESKNIEILSIGVEWKNCILSRPKFWKGLIKEVKAIYNGTLTYCANWDNYERIPFWADLDLIAIDAYFPLCYDCSTEVLKTKTDSISRRLSRFSAHQNKKVFFSEFGYRNIDRALWRQWELPELWKINKENNEIQSMGYQAIFSGFWDQGWFEGGFLWKWFSDQDLNKSSNNSDYTPQNKPAETLIRNFYKGNQ
ncbi:MAG: hypothetical protein MRY83_22780, partial [Flavobacteriales bacterium]|nr:hypothetical protein [Flavobacteriales bacterium]